MAVRLSQIRLSPYSSRPSNPTKKDCFNRKSNPTKAQPLRTPMYQAPHQRDPMADPPTKCQQAGPRRPHHNTHNQGNSNWDVPGRPYSLPSTPRKSHRPDWECEADVMKSLPRQPKRYQTLPEMNHSPEVSGWPYERRASAPKGSMDSDRTADLFTMIDDHLAWNMSASDLIHQSPDPPRPGSSGTMFIDFGADGEVEVSYRNGRNKKLPTPPAPSKTSTPSRFGSQRHTLESKQIPKTTRYTTHWQPHPKYPSHSSRHDSVLTPSASHPVNGSQAPPFPPPNCPLPSLPSRTPLDPQSRKSYPPQVHATSRCASTSRTESQTNAYRSVRPVPASTHAPSFHSSIYAESTHVPLGKVDTNKPLPPPPPKSRASDYRGTRSRRPVVSKQTKKQGFITRLVKKVLTKLDILVDEHQHRRAYRY